MFTESACNGNSFYSIRHIRILIDCFMSFGEETVATITKGFSMLCFWAKMDTDKAKWISSQINYSKMPYLSKLPSHDKAMEAFIEEWGIIVFRGQI